MTGQITWEESPLHGNVLHGKIRASKGALFKAWTLAWIGSRDGNPPYRLVCDLPGIKRDVRVGSVEAGKSRAERQLGVFLGWFDRPEGVRDDDTLVGYAGGTAVVVEASRNVALVEASGRRTAVTNVEQMVAHLEAAAKLRASTEKRG